MQEAEGKVEHRVYQLSSATLYAKQPRSKPRVVRMASCVIPQSDSASALLVKRLQKFRRVDPSFYETGGNGRPSKTYDGGMGKITGEYVCFEYFIVVVCSSSGECVVSEAECTDLRWVEVVEDDPLSGGGGTPVDSGDPCDASEPGSDTYQWLCVEGGGSVPHIEGLPCDTGDPMIDSLPFQLVATAAWNESYGDDLNAKQQTDRKEVGYWITEQAPGIYGFVRFDDSIVDRDFCRIYNTDQLVPPPNAIATVHTHPGEVGESLELQDCVKDELRAQNIEIPGPGDLLPAMGWGPSKLDKDFARNTGLAAYYIDKNDIIKYANDGGVIPHLYTRRTRCGF